MEIAEIKKIFKGCKADDEVEAVLTTLDDGKFFSIADHYDLTRGRCGVRTQMRKKILKTVR